MKPVDCNSEKHRYRSMIGVVYREAADAAEDGRKLETVALTPLDYTNFAAECELKQPGCIGRDYAYLPEGNGIRYPGPFGLINVIAVRSESAPALPEST